MCYRPVWRGTGGHSRGGLVGTVGVRKGTSYGAMFCYMDRRGASEVSAKCAADPSTPNTTHFARPGWGKPHSTQWRGNRRMAKVRAGVPPDGYGITDWGRGRTRRHRGNRSSRRRREGRRRKWSARDPVLRGRPARRAGRRHRPPRSRGRSQCH